MMPACPVEIERIAAARGAQVLALRNPHTSFDLIWRIVQSEWARITLARSRPLVREKDPGVIPAIMAAYNLPPFVGRYPANAGAVYDLRRTVAIREDDVVFGEQFPAVYAN